MKMACGSHSAKQGHRAMPNQSGRLMKQSLLTRHIQTSCGHCAAITYETNPVIFAASGSEKKLYHFSKSVKKRLHM